MDQSELKRFLFSLPGNRLFQFNDKVRSTIRKALFKAVSANGKYLDHFFPDAFHSLVSADEKLHILDTQFDCSFNTYHKSSVCRLKSKFNSHNHHAFHSGLPCARIFRRGEPIYRCLTCGFDDTCALCSHCFLQEYHADHNVHITICTRENGGVCDCGDPEAWVNEFQCPYASSPMSNSLIPEEFQNLFISTIQTLLDYVIDVMTHSDLQFSSPVETTKQFIEFYSRNSELDPLKYGFGDQDDISDLNSSDFCLLIYNDQTRHYREVIQRIRLASRKVKDFAVMVANKTENYGKAIVISSLDIELLRERQKILTATGLASTIRSQRDVFREEMCDEILIWISDLTEVELFRGSNVMKNLFCQAFCRRWDKGLLQDPKIHLLLLYNTGSLDFFNQIPKVPSSKNDTDRLAASSHWKFEPKMWNLDHQMCIDCDYNLSDEDYDLQKSHYGSRFQYFIYFDIRFWKSIRSLLHDMYSTSLITNLEFKNIISSQYVDIYPTVADMFLLKDREPEINIMATLSTQLFTCPSNSTCIVEHGDLSRIFASIYGFLTDEKIKSPQNVDVTHKLSMKSLRNRRWGQIFFDIGYILSRSRYRYSDLILSPDLIAMACDILALFQGRPVLKRESKHHVEFENAEYSSFFQSILVIYQFAESTAHCLNNLKMSGDGRIQLLSKQAVSYVFNFLVSMEKNKYPGLNDEWVDINLSNRNFAIEPISQQPVVDFRIDKEKVSFLHPIHSFASWLLESSSFSSVVEVKEVLEAAKAKATDNSDDISILFEYPIRTIVLMSQVKSGFWVRNGFGVRSQLQLYKNTSLRESGYMRDLFLIQLYSNMYSPDVVCYTILDRWLLLKGWIPSLSQEELRDGMTCSDKIKLLLEKRYELNHNKGEGSNHEVEEDHGLAYDPKTLSYMLDECLNFFIHLLTEDLNLRGLSEDSIGRIRIETEIIQNLCFGHMSYTKLCGLIPDHIVAEKRFDIILEEMTIFTPPNSGKDVGTYRLKEEYFSRVNPYYFNYSTNTKDDAVKLVKEKIQRQQSKDAPPVIMPQLRDPNELGMYRFLGNFTISSYFEDFIITNLLYVQIVGLEKAESLLETLLHLLHICSFENTLDLGLHGSFFDVFFKGTKHSVYYSESRNQTIGFVLYQLLQEETFKAHHTKMRAIFMEFNGRYDLNSAMKSFDPNYDSNKITVCTTDDQKESETDRKKRVAKERQAKLMAKFKKQQSVFLKKNQSSNGDISDTEMEELDESGWSFPEPHCILCQDNAENGGPFGIITYVGKSSEFRSVPFDDKYWFLKAFSDGCNLDEDEMEESENIFSSKWMSYMKKIKDDNVVGPGFTIHEHVDTKLVSLSCGHGMHFKCYMNYLTNNRNRQSQITRNSPDNSEHKEFLCPLCKAINNMFVPILWSNNKREISKYVAPGPIDEGNLNIFNSLYHFKSQKNVWFPKFMTETKRTIEDINILTPAAKRVIDVSLEADKFPGASNDTFKLLISSMSQVLTFFNFPSSIKSDMSNLLLNTIKSAEIALRGESSNETLVIKQMSNNSLINLRSLMEFSNTSLYMKTRSVPELDPRKYEVYVKQLSNLLVFYNNLTFNERVIDQDFFELLVNTLSVPSMGFSFNVLLKATFMGHVIQNIFLIVKNILSHNFYQCSEYSILDVPVVSTVDEERRAVALAVFKKASRSLVHGDDEDMVTNDPKFGFVFYSMLLKASTPFLRRAGIYAHVLCTDDTVSNSSMEVDCLYLEADRLCRFLNIDNLFQLLQKFASDEPFFENLKFNSFFESASEVNLDLMVQLDYPGLIKLIDLPERLDFFFTEYYYSDKYDKPHLSIENPAVCLFCGQIVDIQKTAVGADLGECTVHVQKECPNTVGIFLLPQDKAILLLHKNGGSFIEAPYLDLHGELPVDSKRNNTLYLMKPRYNGLMRNIWLGHNIPNYIVRKLDHVIDAGGWDTL